MRIITISALAMALLVSGGCLDKADRMQAQAPTISNGPATKGDLDGKLADVVDLVGKRMDTSQNAIQSNMQSVVGLSVGKVADDLVKMQAQVDSLVKINNTMSNNMEAKIGAIKTDLSAAVASNNNLQAMLKAQLDVNAQLVASVKVTADLEAKISALGAAQAGIGNQISQQTSEMKSALQATAGHDVNSTNTQFTVDMLNALKSANQTTTDTSRSWAWVLTGIVSALSGIGLAYLHRQKTVAEDRATVAEKRGIETHQRVERALMVMAGASPAVAKEMRPPTNP